MQRTLIGASLATLLLAAPAFAQSTAPSRPATPTAPAEKMEKPSTTMTTPAQRAQTTPMRDHVADMTFRASKLIGSTVYNSANENIGDINEILLDNTGKVSRVVIGVGGFLGMGERNVAVPFTDLKLSQDGSTIKVMTSYNKDSLKNMPAWKWEDTSAHK